MNPREASDIIRHEAAEIYNLLEILKSNTSAHYTRQDLFNYLCLILQQHSEFKLSVASMLHDIGERLPDLNLEVEGEEGQNQNDKSKSWNIEVPPFDVDFWTGLQ